MKLLAAGVVAAALLVAGCAMSTRTMPPATELGGDPGSLESLERGRMLIVTECTEFHRIYWPQEYPSAAWPDMVEDMGNRSALSEAQTHDIVEYYVAAARHAESSDASER